MPQTVGSSMLDSEEEKFKLFEGNVGFVWKLEENILKGVEELVVRSKVIVGNEGEGVLGWWWLMSRLGFKPWRLAAWVVVADEPRPG